MDKVIELVKALRSNGEGCKCFAHSSGECCCDAVWGEDYTSEAAVVLEKLEAENAKLKKMYALLASAWFYGGWEAETHNERLMQKLMQEAGYWPTTEEEIVARAALGETK